MAADGGGFAFGGGGNLEAKITPFVIISLVMAGIIFGYDIAHASGHLCLPPFLEEKHLESDHLFRSYFYVAGLTATFFASYTTRRFGTRLTMFIAGFFFIVGLVFTASAQNLTMLIAGRILLGSGVALDANQGEAGDSRFKGCERICYTRDQVLQLTNNAQAAPLFNDSASPLSPSAIDVVPVAATYDQGMTRKKIEIPKCRVGVIIGRGGETIKYLTLQSRANIQLSSDMDAAADPNSPNRMVELMGTPEAIASAEKLITEILARQAADEFSMKIPNHTVGFIIGKRGDTINSMQAWSGARIQVIPLHLSPGDTSTTERTLKIVGAPHQIESAKHLVNLIMTMSGSGSGVGYSQQGGYRLQSYCSCCRAGILPSAPPPPPPPHWLPHSEASTAGGDNGHSTAIYLPAGHPPPGFDGLPQAPRISYGNTSSSYGAGYAHKPSYASDVVNGVAPAQVTPQKGGRVAKVKLH